MMLSCRLKKLFVQLQSEDLEKVEENRHGG